MDAHLEQLRGTWQAVRIETGGRDAPAESVGRLRYLFEGDRVTLLEGDAATGAGAVSLHAVGGHPAIDVTMTEGAGSGQVALGIYEVVGDRLRLCIGGERPAEFTGAGPAALVELERVQSRPEPGLV
jgi:uncharacterized protein (TIGR03067 family)